MNNIMGILECIIDADTSGQDCTAMLIALDCAMVRHMMNQGIAIEYTYKTQFCYTVSTLQTSLGTKFYTL